MLFVKYYVYFLIYIELIILFGIKVFLYIKQFFKEFKKYIIINFIMCLDYIINWKFKLYINYKIYYVQYFWFFFFLNILNSDNIVMYFLYIDRFKIIDNIKIKYYI